MALASIEVILDIRGWRRIGLGPVANFAGTAIAGRLRSASYRFLNENAEFAAACEDGRATKPKNRLLRARLGNAAIEFTAVTEPRP